MKIKNWLNSNAWYEASAQHYAKAEPHIINCILLILGVAASAPLAQKLSHPITFKIGEIAETITEPIGERTYTRNIILQYHDDARHLTPLFRLHSTKIDKPILVFSDTTKLPSKYYFPIVSTDEERDNLIGVKQNSLQYYRLLRSGHGCQSPLGTWTNDFKREHEPSFRKIFSEAERNKLPIHTQTGFRYYTITPEVCTKLGLTVDETPLTESATIKYSDSALWEITSIAVQYMAESFIKILIAIALQCALKIAINLIQAAANGDSLKDAASKSWQETKAIGHAFLAAGDYAGGCLCKIFIDTPAYVANRIWNQTIGRVYHHDNEQDTDIAGDIADASGLEA